MSIYEKEGGEASTASTANVMQSGAYQYLSLFLFGIGVLYSICHL